MIHKTVISLTPHVVSKVWGGSRLAHLKNLNIEKIGETWEVSIHPDGPSMAEKQNLNEIISKEELPYLIKFIDTSAHLSVQVHPDDNYAQKYENSNGKTECWLILDAGKNSGIYLGFKKNINPERFKQSVINKEDLTPYLQFHPVKRGDFFFVPAGSVHAIGADVFLCEIQQSSGITYRVWDWNRMGDDGKPRQLHIDKAMDVLRFEDNFNDATNFKIQKKLLQKSGHHQLLVHPDFKVELVNLVANQEFEFKSNSRAGSIISLEGQLIIDNSIALNAYNSLLLKTEERVKIRSKEKSSFILVS